MTEQGQDEILELLWTLREERKASRAEVLRSAAEPGPDRLLEELVEGGMVDASGEEILLTKSGEDRARGIIRRHRLAEVLLHNLFDLDDPQLENSACQFEHILSEPVVESVCTFLGHPPACPHGRPVPRGECCNRIRTEIRPLVMPLTEASLGATVRIVAALLFLAIGLWVALGLSESRLAETEAQARSENPFKAFGALLRMRRLVGYGLAGTLNGAVLFTYISGGPDVIMSTYGHSPLVFNIIFAFNAVGIIGASQVNRLLLRRTTPDRVLMRASIASVIFAFLLVGAAWSGLGGQWTVLPLLFLSLSTYGLMGGNTMAGALSVDPKRAGSTSALMGAASFGSGAIAAWISGLLHDGTARPMAGVMFACLIGSSLAIFLIALPEGGAKTQA